MSSSTPSWANVGGSGAPSSTATDLSWASGSNDVEKQTDVSSSEVSSSSFNNKQQQEDSPVEEEKSRLAGCGNQSTRCLYFACFLSLALCGIFAYSSAVQFDDKNAILWFLFYLVHAILSFSYVVHKLCCGMFEKPVLVLAAIMFCWSAVLVGLSANDFAKTDYGGDDDKKRDAIYDIAGSGLGLFSSILYVIFLKCCPCLNGSGNNKMNDEAGLS